ENLTVNETSFFRNKPQLDLFHKVILEDLLHRKQERRDWSLRLWSAGCSTGQEPYTIAMQVCDALAYYYLRNPLPFEMPSPKPLIPPPWKVEILASDINYSVLRTAQEGIYPESGMEPVEYAYRLRYFDKSKDKYAIKRALKELVHFDFHNLKTEFLPQRSEEHTSELQSPCNLVCRLLLEKKNELIAPTVTIHATEQRRLVEGILRRRVLIQFTDCFILLRQVLCVVLRRMSVADIVLFCFF